MIFKGTATALVTPFTPDGAIDFGAFNRLLDTQIAAGIEGVVPCGSTGEAATMTHDEKVALIRHTVEYVAGRT
ncbi:MAG: dihydrodipicolinate synthase family protein, partial [Candidatus Kapabacteria bacterium]|nr:dihydrodipicolinate synthase family protein [Candidatus Kapabacteria bacterium]